jgi:hypothetical protein
MLIYQTMAFPRPSSPATAWRDLRAFLGQQERHKFLFALIAIAMPALIVAGFYVDSRPDKPKAQIIYVQSWPATRSDDEIKKQQKIDQAKKNEAMAQRRRQYQKLEKQLGI